MKNGEYEEVHSLLNDDAFLNGIIKEKLSEGQECLRRITEALKVISTSQSISTPKPPAEFSSLYIAALSGALSSSPVVKELLLSIRKLPSDKMQHLLTALIPFQVPDLSLLLDDLTTLLSSTQNPLQSSDSTHHTTVCTAITADKISLRRQTSTLSKQDLAYSQLVTRIDATLFSYFKTTLINPQKMFLNELLIYDLKSPHRDVFAPRPRTAVERALSSPHDYLGCECCEGGEAGVLSQTQPSTAVLYQLYLESGASVNGRDLWNAFWAVVGREAEDEEEEQKAM